MPLRGPKRFSASKRGLRLESTFLFFLVFSALPLNYLYNSHVDSLPHKFSGGLCHVGLAYESTLLPLLVDVVYIVHMRAIVFREPQSLKTFQAK